MEVYGPYQVMLNVDRISIYTRTYVTKDSDQMGQIYLGQEELKVRRFGQDAMMEQDAVHIGYEADVTADDGGRADVTAGEHLRRKIGEADFESDMTAGEQFESDVTADVTAGEHLRGKIGEGDFESLRAVLNRNADVFSKDKADIGCCNFVEHEIELEEGAVPHREGARRMTAQEGARRMKRAERK